MAALTGHAVLAEQKRREWEEAQRMRAEADRVRAEKEARIREEKQKVGRLLADVDAWHRAEQIRAFVDNTRKRIRQARGPSVAGQVEEWAKWALSHADRLDPIVEHEPTALDE
jgi:molecular chaperone GrpE (heat shock protein)